MNDTSSGDGFSPLKLPPINTVWYVFQEDCQYGPYSFPEMANFVSNGTVTPDTFVWRDGMPDWAEAGSVPSLAKVFWPQFRGRQSALTPATMPSKGFRKLLLPCALVALCLIGLFAFATTRNRGVSLIYNSPAVKYLPDASSYVILNIDNMKRSRTIKEIEQALWTFSGIKLQSLDNLKYILISLSGSTDDPVVCGVMLGKSGLKEAISNDLKMSPKISSGKETFTRGDITVTMVSNRAAIISTGKTSSNLLDKTFLGKSQSAVRSPILRESITQANNYSMVIGCNPAPILDDLKDEISENEFAPPGLRALANAELALVALNIDDPIVIETSVQVSDPTEVKEIANLASTGLGLLQQFAPAVLKDSGLNPALYSNLSQGLNNSKVVTKGNRVSVKFAVQQPEVQSTFGEGIIAGMIAPAFVDASNDAKARKCRQNLAVLDGSKDAYALENRLGNNSVVTMTSLINGDYIAEEPICPSGGTYSLNAIGHPPTCSIGDNSNSDVTHELQ